MCINNNLQEKISCMSFKELDNYFSDPDLKIQNLYKISAQQFTKDLDSIIAFSKKALGQYGKIDTVSITIDSNTTEKGKRRHLINSVQKCEKFKLHKLLSKLFNNESQPITRIKIKSWNFTEFDDTQKLQVGNLYTIKPVSVTYNSTQQEYKYDKQIISEFCIEEANGTIKKLLIIDTIKKGKVQREKHIDDHKINRQHYNFEIRSHRLNRSLMKTFLFHQINRHKTSEYGQNSALRHKKTDSGFVESQPIEEMRYQAMEPGFTNQKPAENASEEYIKFSVFKAHSQNQKKAVDINNVYNLQTKFNKNAADDHHAQVQELFRMENDLIYVADDFNDLKLYNMLTFP